MANEIRVFLIYEMLGKPPEHIKMSLENFVEEFNGKDKIKLISKKIHEPKLVEAEGEKDTREIFTTFAEIEIEVEDLNMLFVIIMNTLPSNVEILEPSSLSIKNYDLSMALSELTMKLHKYDEVTKVLTFERKNLIEKIKKLEGDGNGEKKGVEGNDKGNEEISRGDN